MNAHVAEIVTEMGFHNSPGALVKRLTGSPENFTD